MNLKDAFPRPTGEETELARKAVVLRLAAGPMPWSRAMWKAAAVVASLLAAYGAGFVSGRQVGSGRRAEPVPIEKAGAMIIRPPVLIAGPRS